MSKLTPRRRRSRRKAAKVARKRIAKLFQKKKRHKKMQKRTPAKRGASSSTWEPLEGGWAEFYKICGMQDPDNPLPFMEKNEDPDPIGVECLH